MARRVFYVRGTDEAGNALATSIQIILPPGLNRFQAIEFITGRVAGEVSRYFAAECLGEPMPTNTADWQKPIT